MQNGYSDTDSNIDDDKNDDEKDETQPYETEHSHACTDSSTDDFQAGGDTTRFLKLLNTTKIRAQDLEMSSAGSCDWIPINSDNSTELFMTIPEGQCDIRVECRNQSGKTISTEIHRNAKTF